MDIPAILAAISNFDPTALAIVALVVLSAFALVWKALTLVKLAIAAKKGEP